MLVAHTLAPLSLPLPLSFYQPMPLKLGHSWRHCFLGYLAFWACKKGALIKIRARNSRWSTNKKKNKRKKRKTLAQMSLLFGHFQEVSGRGGGGGRVGQGCRISLLCMLYKCPAAFFGPFYVARGLLLIFTVAPLLPFLTLFCPSPSLLFALLSTPSSASFSCLFFAATFVCLCLQ